jgi:hypothetical protein
LLSTEKIERICRRFDEISKAWSQLSVGDSIKLGWCERRLTLPNSMQRTALGAAADAERWAGLRGTSPVRWQNCEERG